MHHQKMVILGLIAINKKYGLEIEEFIDKNDIRRWAKIGSSTIYKVLKDLDADGAIVGQDVTTDKGPKRRAYTLTARGKSELRALILESLRSDTSIFSDRIAGLFFTPLLGKEKAQETLEGSIQALLSVNASLDNSLKARKGDYIAEAIIQFYREVYSAEIRAMQKISENLM